jgi:excisionase family DNA binding protein
MMAKLYTIKDAAQQLSCSERHVGRMIAAGKLETVDIGLGQQKVLRVRLPDTSTPTKNRRRKTYKPEILTGNG